MIMGISFLCSLNPSPNLIGTMVDILLQFPSSRLQMVRKEKKKSVKLVSGSSFSVEMEGIYFFISIYR